MGGPDTIKGISFQASYTLYRVMDLLDEDSKTKSVHVEGKGEDIEDVTITMTDGTEEVIQTKKRETEAGTLGIWGLSDLKSIIQALFQITHTGRPVTVYRFVSNANAHERVLGIQKTCQRLRQKGFSFEKDGKALADVREMVSADDMTTMEFMRKLWLDLPSESESFYQQSVQNELMKKIGVSPEDAGLVFDHLYKQVLDRGKEIPLDLRTIDRGMLLNWLEEVPQTGKDGAIQVKVNQWVKIHRGKMTGIDAEELAPGNYEINQKVSTVEKDGEVIGLKLGKKS